MSPSVVSFYLEQLHRFREEMDEAATADERRALSECIVTCQLRLAGVP